MKCILRSLVFGFISLFGASQIVTGFSYGGDISILLFAALIFGFANSFVKPVLKIITLPLNIATLGLFSLLTNIVILFITVRLVPGLTIASFRFPGFVFNPPFDYSPITISSFDVSAASVLLITSLVISIFMITLEFVFGNG